MFKKIVILSLCFVCISYANDSRATQNKKNDAKITKFYKKKCAKCHGEVGEGVKGKEKKPPINMLGKKKDKDIFTLIRKGYKGKIGRMPKFKKSKINDKDLTVLVKYIKAFDKTKK